MTRFGAGVLLLGGFIGVSGRRSGCRSDARTPLTIYSPHGRDLLGLVEKEFERAHPEVDVRWLDMGSQEVYDRLRSEKANPQADVWYGGPDTTFARAAREGLLAGLPSRLGGRGRAGQPARGRSLLRPLPHARDAGLQLEGDPGRRSAARMGRPPRSEVEGQDPHPRSARLGHDARGLGIHPLEVREGDRLAGGRLRVARPARHADQGVRLQPHPPLRKDRPAGRPLTIWDLPDTLLERERGSPLQYVFPKSGTPVIDDAVGVVAGSRHADTAKRFVDFLGTKPMQRLAAEKTYRLPARMDMGDDLPQWARDVERDMVPADVDWALVEKHGAEWMATWDQTVRGKGASALAP